MFFYLEWIYKRPSCIEIRETKPENITYETTFKIKKEEFVLCGNISSNLTDYVPDYNFKYRKNQYLLSHLQKCIRRTDSMKSVKSAKHLLDLDINSFMRRLPIIMLEDVTIHESFPVIVWLMIAVSKKDGHNGTKEGVVHQPYFRADAGREA